MLLGVLNTSSSVSGCGRVSSWTALEGGGWSMGMGSTQSFMLFVMLPSSSGAKKGTVSGSCSAIVSEECRKGVCEVVTWTSVMNAVVVVVVDEYPDNMSVYHSDCMCNSGWCVGSSTVLSRPLISPLRVGS